MIGRALALLLGLFVATAGTMGCDGDEGLGCETGWEDVGGFCRQICDEAQPCPAQWECVEGHCQAAEAPSNAPEMVVEPTAVTFASVKLGEVAEETVAISNQGLSDLVVDSVLLVGSEHIGVEIAGAQVVASESAEKVALVPPLTVAPGESKEVVARFAPLDPKPADAGLTLYSNDPSNPEGLKIYISGNQSAPCFAVNPSKVNFGGKLIGKQSVLPLKLAACGESALLIYDVRLSDQSSADFDVDLTPLEQGPTLDEPLKIPIGAFAVVNVVFTPASVSPVGEDGELVMSNGTLVIESNALVPVKEVPLTGAGVELDCPTAIIKSAEGDEVIPQTVMHLFGDESYAGGGEIKKWEWAVEQPAGSQSVFVPSYTFPNPTFEANVAGVYKFSLTVYDGSGVPSCFPATYEVAVIPDEAVHIELLWHTPEDPDETDTGPEAGADMDLHFLHPWAAGPDLDGDGKPDGWFDIPFDCFWFNAHPNWGSYEPGVDDDAGLDRDDTDGAGPENLNLNVPENVVYRVGAHYWNDHGYGASFATVRVYIYAQLVFEEADVMLVDSDMWDICTINWPSGKVAPVAGESGNHKITHDYHNPYFFQ